MTRAPRRRTGIAAVHIQKHATALLLAGCSLIGMVGCDSGGEADTGASGPSATDSSPSPTTSTASADPASAAKAEVLTAYDHFWDEQVKAYAQGNAKGTDLRKYSAALAWAQTDNDLKQMTAKDIVARGRPTHHVEFTDVQPHKKVPGASFKDCLDTTNWKRVYRKTGKPVSLPKNQIKRFTTRVKAEKWGTQWKIIEIDPQQRAC